MNNMEPENVSQEVEVEQKSQLHQVTPLSKYLAMVLFILMPFIGGYIGYAYAPEKVVERVVVMKEHNTSSIAEDSIDNKIKKEYIYVSELRPGDIVEKGKRYVDSVEFAGVEPADTQIHIDLEADLWNSKAIEKPDSLRYFGAGIIGDGESLYSNGIPCEAALLQDQLDLELGIDLISFKNDSAYIIYNSKVYTTIFGWGLGCSLMELDGLDGKNIEYVGEAGYGEYIKNNRAVFFVPKDENREFTEITENIQTFRVQEFPFPEVDRVRKEGSVYLGVDNGKLFYATTNLSGLDSETVLFDEEGLTFYDDQMLWAPDMSCNGILDYEEDDRTKLGTFPVGGC